MSFRFTGILAITLAVSACIPAQEAITPKPATFEKPLTVTGIIEQTNAMRKKEGLPPLIQDTALDAIALVRVRDMFMHQYIAHESPQGQTPQSVAKEVSYAYIRLGENIAAGLFEGDADVVDQWMHSPGHRAQIVDPKMTHIGVGAEKTMLEGHEQWVAVQIFSVPRKACPEDPSTLEIEALKATLAEIDANQETLKKRIDTEKNSDMRRRLIERYNESLAGRNALAQEINGKIEEYEEAWEVVRGCVEEK